MNEDILTVEPNAAAHIWETADFIIDYYLDSIGTGVSVVHSSIGSPKDYEGSQIHDRLLAAAEELIFRGQNDNALNALQEIKDYHRDRSFHEGGLREDLVDGIFSDLERLAKQAISNQERGLKVNAGKLKDSFVAAGVKAATILTAGTVQKKLEKKFDDLENKLRRGPLSDKERRIYEHLRSCEGQYAVIVDPRTSAFVTDSRFQEATLNEDSLWTKIAERHHDLRAKKRNSLIFYAGGVARNNRGDLTTLGEGGLVHSALALAAAISANKITMIGDTDGIPVVDPLILGDTQRIRSLSRREAVALAYWGGPKVLPENVLGYLRKKQHDLTIVVRNLLNRADPGTLITGRADDSFSAMKSIATIPNVSYREFPVLNSDQHDQIVDFINSYDGAEVIWHSLENGRDKRSKILVRVDPEKQEALGGDHFRVRLYKECMMKVFGKKNVNGGYHCHDLSLVTTVGRQIGNSDEELAKIEKLLAQVDWSRETRGRKFRFPIIREENSIGVLVESANAQDFVRSVYNGLKQINIILYGLGNIGPEFLHQLMDKYSHLGVNLIAVADSSGAVAKVGGLTKADKELIVQGKKNGKRLSDMDLGERGIDFLTPRFYHWDLLDKLHKYVQGDFVLVDATNDGQMGPTWSKALYMGGLVVTINKKPFTDDIDNVLKDPTRYCLEYDQRSSLTELLFMGIHQHHIFNRGTVGADIGVPDNLIEILGDRPGYVTVKGCMSGTLGYTCSVLEQGKSLSEAIGGAIEKGYTEPKPFDDYAGLDVLNKTWILWRMIAMEYHLDPFEIDVKYESFISSAIRLYQQETRDRIDESELAGLTGDAFIEKMKLLDTAFSKLAGTLPKDHVFRYVGEIKYDEDTKKYSIEVGLKAVAKKSSLGALEGPENKFVFGINGPSDDPYVVLRGPGAGIETTAKALIHDLESAVNTLRGALN